MIVTRATGRDPGMEIIHKIWIDGSPFWTLRAILIEHLEAALDAHTPGFSVEYYPESRAQFTYRLHALPDEVSSTIGISTPVAARNAAVYVARIEDERLTKA